MIQVDAKEFRGDRAKLAKYLEEKLKTRAQVVHETIRIGDDERAAVSLQDVKDMVRRGLHRMATEQYHVTVEKGTITIRERRVREHHAKRRKGSVPSAQQTVPYFFPG
jgi:hypothetical protein